MSKGKILFQLSGSIAAFKACQLLSRLVQSGFEVEVVATRSALSFVGEATLEGLTGRRVHTETFAAGQYMNHIHLARWADLILVCPASANVINKLAGGIADDLLTTLFLAHDFKKPYLIAPAMNAWMYKHPATQASFARLKEWGVEIVESGVGHLACGEVGEGRLIEPEILFRVLTEKMSSPVATRGKILITSGGTREPIDGVRSITNTSTGQTGAALSDAFTAKGFEVTYLHATNAARPERDPAHSLTFDTFADLQLALSSQLKSNQFSACLHAAAVSDYGVSSIENEGRPLSGAEKIESGTELTLRLTPHPKLVDEIREASLNPAIKIVAFKLTNSTDPTQRLSAVQKLASRSEPDLIVHNDLRNVSSSRHAGVVYDGEVREVAEFTSKMELAEALDELLFGSGSPAHLLANQPANSLSGEKK